MALRLTKIERLAAQIATEAPARPGNRTVRIRAALITELRTELSLRGFDWVAGLVQHGTTEPTHTEGNATP